MSIKDQLKSATDTILSTPWDERDGTVVPTSDSIKLAGGAVRLDATLLYADLRDSTTISMGDKRVAAKLFKCFLGGCSRIIRHNGGEIRSFDGDRVMGVFLGGTKNTDAAKSALKINWFVVNVLRPKFKEKYSKFSDGTYKINHCTGVDTSSVLVVRAGIRDNNDLVWVGRAPNVAAKLSDRTDAASYISPQVYNAMLESSKISSDGSPMWKRFSWPGGPIEAFYRSDWTWVP
nr:adenylate/guanylate cyclase domain-containing protein [Nitrosomonas nitrosa]